MPLKSGPGGAGRMLLSFSIGGDFPERLRRLTCADSILAQLLMGIAAVGTFSREEEKSQFNDGMILRDEGR